MGPPEQERVDASGVIKFCQSQGLKLEKEFEPSKLHFGLIFKKS